MSAKFRSLDDFLLLLKGVKPGKNGQFTALCPGHDDRNRSLSVKQADGKLLVKCFAGCETADILKSLNLEPKDLFLNSHKGKPEHRKIEAIYHYTDAKGKPFEVVRTKPKGFYQRQPDGKGGYINNLKGITPTLYHADELREAIAAGKTILVLEGEKDTDNVRKLGMAATCNPMGAGKWRDSYSETLRGADLIIIPDADGPGRDHAAQLARSCYGKAARIRVLELPDGSKDVSDWLAIGHTANELTQLASQSLEYEPPVDTTLPEILVTDRHLRDITADALDALYKGNKPKRIFRRSSALTRITLDEKARPFTETLSESALRGYLARSCNFVRITKDENGAEQMKPVPPPLDVVRDINSLGDWQFPPLLGITEAPVIRPEGTIITEQGYDAITNLYYFPSVKLTVPPIPNKPTDDDIKAAIKLALEPVYDFPFDSEASRANAIATMFTPILRPMIDGPVPLVIIDKPQAGTGASLLAEVISLIATGRAAAMMTARKDDEEWRKTITSVLLRGQLVATVDNIESTSFTPSLAALLTATTYQDRILGRSEMLTLPNRTTWLATGNNIKLAGDLPRRCIWVRMDAKTARPWMRDISNFKHPRLIEWVSENRGNILAAILTIARAWVMASMSEAQGLPNLGGYESYCRVVGGVLAYMSVNGFLANLDAMYNETDSETPQWEAFLEAWLEFVGKNTATVAEIIKVLDDNNDFRASLPDSLAGKDARDYSRRLGNALSKRNGVHYPNGLLIQKAGEKKRATLWQVVSYENANSPQFSFGGELGELGLAPARGKIKDNDNNILYREGVGINSPNSLLAIKSGELTHPDTTPPADYAAVLGMPVEDAIELWQSVGAPVIHLGPGVNCLDLEKLLSRPDVASEHLKAVRAWLQQQKGGDQ